MEYVYANNVYPFSPVTPTADIIRDHGRNYETIFNGTFATFHSEAADEVIDAMKDLGHSCVMDCGLVSEAITR